MGNGVVVGVRLAGMREVSRSVSVLALVAGLLCGCGMTTPRMEPTEPAELSPLPEEMPADFGLSVTVLSDEIEPGRIGRLPRWQRPARFVIEPDRVLRASDGPGVSTRLFPAATRRLDAGQMLGLWEMVRGTGVVRPGHPGAVAWSDGEPPISAGSVAVITVSAGGERRTVIVPVDEADPDAGAARVLVDRLADLAWIRR